MRLIDGDALMDEANSDGAYGYVDAKQISESPTIDAAPVVRCKDCKYYRYGKHFTNIKFCQRLPYYAAEGGLNTADDDFCSYGERKEGGK